MDYSFELNNARKDETFASGKVTAQSPVVEIFSAMANGEEISKFGAKADKAANYIKELGKRGELGDQSAISELNEIRKFAMQPRLLQEIKLLGLFGSYKPLAWGDTAYLEKISFENVGSRIQAEGQDVSTPFVRKTKTPLVPVTISAGYKVNYRELALGDMTNENLLMGEVRTEIKNKATMYVLQTVVEAIQQAKGVKYYFDDSGISKTNMDKLLTQIRRYGKPNVIADYAILSQIVNFSGFIPSERIINEIMDTGIFGKYMGATLSEIPNAYNLTKLNADGDDYDTILPQAVGFVTPTAPVGGVAPIQTFSIGGLTSFSGTSVSTGEILTRYDFCVAAGVASADGVGVFQDTNLPGVIGDF